MTESLKILIVDDEQSMLITLEDILKVMGYSVFTAGNGEQSIELVKKEQIDVVLMDYKMPGMSGVEAFREIIKIDPSINVIFITAYYDESVIREALSEGMGAICHKPLNIPQLLDYIKATTGKRNRDEPDSK